MRTRSWWFLGLALLGGAGALLGPIARAQVKSPASKYPISAAFDPTYEVPRTPDGHADLQGVYNYFTYTPYSRPQEFGDKEFFTEAEAEEIEAQAKERPCVMNPSQLRYVEQPNPMSWEEGLDYARREFEAVAAQSVGPWMPCNPGIPLSGPSNLGRGFQGDFYDFGNWGPSLAVSRRTSLVVDPSQGQLPALTPLGLQMRIEAAARDFVKRGPEDFPNAMRCIVGDPAAPTTLRSFPYSNFLQILQSRDYVVFRHDLNTYPRIVPLHERAQLPADMKQWMGDAHGRWEGDTLVVEIDNFRPDADPRNGISPGHLIERWTRIAPDYLLYEFTNDNPAMYTQPYTVHYYPKREDTKVFEYACHEANYNMTGELGGKRELEEAAQEK